MLWHVCVASVDASMLVEKDRKMMHPLKMRRKSENFRQKGTTTTLQTDTWYTHATDTNHKTHMHYTYAMYIQNVAIQHAILDCKIWWNQMHFSIQNI